MKHRWIFILSLILLTTGCSEVSKGEQSDRALNLYGTYELVEESDTSSYVTRAVISEDNVITITNSLVSGELNIEQTFWIGSFEPPQGDAEPYKWTSVKDQEALDNDPDAVLTSVDQLEFTYENNQISYNWDQMEPGEVVSSVITLTRIEE